MLADGLGHRRASAGALLIAIAVVLLLVQAAILSGAARNVTGPVDQAPSRTLAAVPDTAFDWPELHQNPQLTGYTTNTTLSTSNASKLGVRWATDLYAAALDSPVVAYDPSLSETLAYVGTEAGNVLAVNIANGQIVWSHWFGAPIRGSPVVNNGSLYVSTFSTPAIYKLNATTGAIGCHLVAPQTVESTATVVTPLGGVPTLYVGSDDTNTASGPLIAMNAATCAKEWEFEGYNQTAGSWDSVSYGVDANGVPLIVFGTADPDSSVYALNALTGKEVWRFQTYNPGPYDVGAGAVITAPGVNGFADGMVYVPNKYGIMYGLNLTTGTEVWSTNFNKIAGATEGGRSTAALDGTNLVFGYNGGVFDLNALTGAVIWQYKDSSDTEVLSSPAIVGPSGEEIVAAADIGGHVDVLSLANGAVLYTYQTGGYITASPAISDGNILVASSDQFLYDFAVGGGNDASLPTAAITSPVSGGSVTNPNGDLTVTGTATDTVGVAGVSVAIQTSGPGGPWWDAASASWSPGPIGNPAKLATPGGLSSTWSFSYPVPSAGGTYEVTAYAASTGGQSGIKAAVTEFSVLASTKGPHIKASPEYIAPGASVTVTGAGFAASEEVSLSLDGTVLATVTARASGTIPSTKVKIPSTTAFGLSSILATGETSGKSATAPIIVQNAWEQGSFNAGGTNFEPNDPTLNLHVYVGNHQWLALAWHYDAGVDLNASPVVADGVAYVGDTAGQLFAVDIQNGGLLWTWALSSGAPIIGSPAVDPSQNLVFVSAADGSLSAISAASGGTVWSTSVGEGLSPPVFGDGDLYVTLSGGAVKAFSETSGDSVWSVSGLGPIGTSPSLDTAHQLLVVGLSDGNLLELNASSGVEEWTVATPGDVNTTATISGGEVYFGAGDVIEAVSEFTGSKLWSYTAGTPLSTAGALLTEGTVGGKTEYVIGSADGYLYAVEASNGTFEFEVKWSSPLVGIGAVDGIVVVETASGVLSATRGYTDLVIWTYTTMAGLVTAPIIVDGTVFAAASDGNLYAFTTFGQPPD